MAKSNWEMDLKRLVLNMAPDKRQEVYDAVTELNTLKQQKDAGQKPPAADQVKAWLHKNGPLAAALQKELDGGATFGMAGGERDDVREVIRSISGGYRYALGDWSTEPNAIGNAIEFMNEANSLPGFKKFQDLVKRVSEGKEEHAKDIRIANAAAANKVKQEKDKADRKERQELIGSIDKDFVDYLRRESGNAVEEEVWCQLISPSGELYESSHLTFLTDDETHPVAELISKMDRVDHSIKSCAEFKVLNSYLLSEQAAITKVDEIKPGGHTIAYVYKKRGTGLEPMSKAACQNCGSWLAKLGWTSAPGKF